MTTYQTANTTTWGKVVVEYRNGTAARLHVPHYDREAAQLRKALQAGDHGAVRRLRCTVTPA